MSGNAVIVYADEACLGNGREQACPGGAGGLVEVWRGDSVSRRDFYYAEPDTTNNRMAIRSAILALELLEGGGNRILTLDFYSDSEYLVKGIKYWMSGWVRRGWKNVKNVELWQRLKELNERHRVSWYWVRGHAGTVRNEYADLLATRAAKEQRSSNGLVESGFLEWLAARQLKGKHQGFEPNVRPMPE